MAQGMLIRTQKAVQILVRKAVERDQVLLNPFTDTDEQNVVDGTTVNQTLLFLLIDSLGADAARGILDSEAENDRERNAFRNAVMGWEVFEAARKRRRIERGEELDPNTAAFLSTIQILRDGGHLNKEFFDDMRLADVAVRKMLKGTNVKPGMYPFISPEEERRRREFDEKYFPQSAENEASDEGDTK